jgi:calcineurin-like phosphoesterase family protein
MNDAIIETWNASVCDDDRVIVVGDLTAGLYDRKEQLAETISKLKGRKTLVVGNHDHLSKKWYREAGFEIVVNHILEDGILFVHKPATELNIKSIKLQVQYKPKLIVHGHIHAIRPEIAGHFNVAWDRCQRMINMDEIIRMCEI